MDQGEIVRSYREAKNKEKQIQILADLNGSSPEQIRQILIAAGEPAEKKRPGPKAKEIRQLVVKPLPDSVKKAITERMIRLTEEIDRATAELKELDTYMKEGENIADFLNITEAHKALMEFENTRIYKGMRNMVNRKVNCEAANITKTVNAATRQVEDIRLIREKMGLEGLPEPLRQMAYVRLENPQASLGELGKLLDPPVGKSGVNHRLRKLGELAKELKVK